MRMLIMGAGEVGRFLGHRLSPLGDVVILDRDPEALREAEEQLDARTVLGDGLHRTVLRSAEVERADVFLAVTRDDAANLGAAALAETMGADRTIARIGSPKFFVGEAGVERKVLGVDALLCASRLTGAELLRRIIATEAKFVLALAGGEIEVAGVEIDDGSPLVGTVAARAKLGRGVQIAGVLRGGRMEWPNAVSELDIGDIIVIFGTAPEVGRATWAARGRKPGRVVVIGGGQSGTQVAASLADLEFDVRLVERDRRRCEVLADELPHVSVQHGDGTQLSFLQSERIDAAGVLVAVTRSDEVNLMASLLARQLGVKSAFALAHRPGYASVYDALGITGTTSAHEVLGRAVDWLLPGRRVVARVSLPGARIDVAELRLYGLYRVGSGLHARDLPVPPGCRLVGLVREGRLERDPSSAIEVGDHAMALGEPKTIDAFNAALETLVRRRGK